MGLLIFSIICLALIVNTFRYGERIVFHLPIYLVLFEIIYLFQPFSFFGTARNIILLSIVGGFFIKKLNLKVFRERYMIYIILYFAYRILYSSSSPLSSLNALFVLSIPLMSYFVSSKAFCSFDDLNTLLRNSFISIVIFALAMISSNIFKIGLDQYSAGFRTAFTFEKIFFAVFALFMFPLYLKVNASHFNKFKIFFFVLAVILITLNMNRTSILLLILGSLIYIVFHLRRGKNLINIIIVLLLLGLGLFLIRESIIEKMDTRMRIIEKREGIQNEGRFMEFGYVIHESRKENTEFFGKQAFNSPGNYANGLFRDRPLHVDLMILYHGFGIVGLLLFLGFLIILLIDVLKFGKYRNRSALHNEVFFIALFFIVGRFATLFSGGLLVMSFNSLIMIYIGIIASMQKLNARNINWLKSKI
ncbi:MAG: hypothetical protein PHG67_10020 [Bacteroidales bacterium]|nr:hypothetical protein [Bacteroidales bacterium]